MRVICRTSSGNDLPDSCQELGYTSRSKLDVTINHEYVVYAMMLTRGVLNYLIVDKHDLPSWIPAAAFDVIDGAIPSQWIFGENLKDRDYVVEATWGFRELVEDETFFDDLAVGNDDARATCFGRMREIAAEVGAE
jgi:hypothetical protein